MIINKFLLQKKNEFFLLVFEKVCDWITFGNFGPGMLWKRQWEGAEKENAGVDLPASPFFVQQTSAPEFLCKWDIKRNCITFFP